MNVHYEACTHLHRVVQAIRDEGMLAGVTLNPHTPVSVLEEIAPYLDLVMLMSVNPGFGGQRFIPTMVEKTRKLRALLDACGSEALIEVESRDRKMACRSRGRRARRWECRVQRGGSEKGNRSIA